VPSDRCAYRPRPSRLLLTGVALLATCIVPGIGTTPTWGVEALEEAFIRARADPSVIFEVPLETDYIPNVVQAENGAASFEALKAQAVAARSFLYYRLDRDEAVFDGTADQVYSDGVPPLTIHERAASDTEREILRFASGGDPFAPTDVTVAGLYVAGARPDASTGVAPFGVAEVPPDADPTDTEQFVTYNQGRFGNAIDQSPLGLVTDPPLANPNNRGAMSQNGSDFLSDHGLNYVDILRFYYGADIRLEMATTPKSGNLAAPKTIADFEVDAGYFGNDPAATPGHQNVRLEPGRTSTSIVDTDAVTGGAAQRLVIDHDEAAGESFVFRHLAGINDVTSFLGAPVSNLAVEPVGSISLWLKTDDPGINAALVLDDSENHAGLGRWMPVVADGRWHRYEWFLRDAGAWNDWDVGSFDLAGLVSIDSLLLRGRGDAELLLDTVVYDPAAIPEPGVGATLAGAAAWLGLARRRRRPPLAPSPNPWTR